MSQNIVLSLPTSLTLPVEFFDNTPYIEGLMNGRKCRFLFDSGGQSLALNANRFDPAGLEDSGGVMGVTGKVQTHNAVLEDLSFGDWQIKGREVMVLDMKHLEEEVGTEIDGIIGFKEMINFDWMVDYGKGELHLWERFPRDEYKLLERTRIHFRHHLPIVELKIAGEPLQFIVDTGCSINCIDRNLMEKIGGAVTGLEEEKLASASPNEIDVLSGTLEGFQVGKLEFGPSEAKYMDLSQMQQRFGHFDGITGYPLLKQYKTVQSWSFSSLFFLE